MKRSQPRKKISEDFALRYRTIKINETVLHYQNEQQQVGHLSEKIKKLARDREIKHKCEQNEREE